MAGCGAERESSQSGVQFAVGQLGNSKGLEFLADIPSLKGVSLQMSDTNFLTLVHRRKLGFKRGIEADLTTTYTVPVKDGGAVIFMFRDGHCAGIQRVGAAGA